ncbi:MAG: hypothetical protein AAGF92_03135 [Myxococcota bacterium]
MIAWMIRRKIDAFENEYAYDVSYLRDLLDTSLGAMMRFHKATGLGEYREGVPRDAWHAVRVFTSRREDCGPCTQLVATMAEREGVPADVIRGALRGDFEGLPDDARLSLSFAKAVLDRDPAADSLRAELVAAFGRKGLVAIAFAMLSARLYPTLKYALGYGHTCAVVQVAGAPVPTPQEAL